MSYPAYLVLHVSSVIFAVLATSSLSSYAMGGGDPRWRRTLVIVHGVALLLLLVSGFGLLARLGVGFPFPAWIWGKLAVWLGFGALAGVARRVSPQRARVLWWLTGVIGVIGAWLAVAKP